MRVFICVVLMLAGLGGGIALALTTDSYSQLFGLYDARGLGFIASITVFLLGLLLLFVGGKKPKPASGSAAAPRRASQETQAEAADPAGPSTPVAAPEAGAPDRPEPAAAEEVAAPTPAAAQAAGADTPVDKPPADGPPDSQVSLETADKLFKAARKSNEAPAFDDAIAAYVAIIGGQERAKLEESPLVAAKIGNAYLAKARLSGDVADAQSAIRCFEVATEKLLALEETGPLAEMFYRLGQAQNVAFGQTKEDAALEAAREAFQRGAGLVSADDAPEIYVQLHHELGNALRLLGQRSNDPATLESALEQFRASLGHCSSETLPRFWVLNVERAALAKETLGKLGERPEQNIREATAHLQAIAEAIPALNMPNLQGRIEKHLERLTEKAANQSQG